jgi:hypothetical protein
VKLPRLSPWAWAWPLGLIIAGAVWSFVYPGTGFSQVGCGPIGPCSPIPLWVYLPKYGGWSLLPAGAVLAVLVSALRKRSVDRRLPAMHLSAES